MRTNIDIDDALMAKAMESTGLSVKKQVVEEALKALIRAQAMASIREMRGTIEWDGDLHDMRRSKFEGQDW